MTDYRAVLGRDLRRAGRARFTLDDLHRQRLRRQRRARAEAVIVGLLVTILALGALFYAFAQRTAPRPAAPSITPGNVGDLRLLQTLHVGGRIDSAVEADGRVYVRARNAEHDLLAYPASCGATATPCRPLWGADLSGTGHPVSAGIAVGRGSVYAAGARLRAFSADCANDGSVCAPRWTSTSSGRSIAAVVAGDVVVSIDYDHVAAFPADCAPVDGACHPLWVSTRFPTHLAPFVTVAGDRAFVGSLTPNRNGPGPIYTLPLHCRADGGECARNEGWQPPAPAGEGTTSSGSRIYMGTAIDGFHGGLRAYPSSCFGAQRCAPLWTTRAPGALNSPAPVVGDGKVFVFSNFGADFVEAFPAACNAGCQPIWRAFGVHNMTPTAPSFSNGVFYVGSFTDGLKAFRADCPSTCVPAWTWRGANGIPPAIRTVVATPDRVFAGSADGNLYVFGPGASGGPSRTTANGIAVAVYGGLALVLLARVATRLRRRVRP